LSVGSQMQLTEQKANLTSQILKVNHAGEHGAIAIYRAQIAQLGNTRPELTKWLNETLGHEIQHKESFRAAMEERSVTPCGALAVWSVGGSVLGRSTALLGPLRRDDLHGSGGAHRASASAGSGGILVGLRRRAGGPDQRDSGRRERPSSLRRGPSQSKRLVSEGAVLVRRGRNGAPDHGIYSGQLVRVGGSLKSAPLTHLNEGQRHLPPLNAPPRWRRRRGAAEEVGARC
jgi:hypothetical protein